MMPESGPLTIANQATELFNKQCRPYQYSGFGFPKRTELTIAQNNGSLRVEMCGGSVVMAALVKTLNRDHSHNDFRGESVTMRAGDVFVSDIAVADGVDDSAVASFVSALMGPDDAIFGPNAVWMEVYQEHPRWMRFMTPYQGWHPAGYKIMAGSEIKVIYCTDEGKANAQNHLDPADVPVLLTLEPSFLTPEQLAQIRMELLDWVGRGKAFENHYSIYNETDSWGAFALKGFKEDDPSYIIKPTEMSKKWRAANPADLRDYTTPVWTKAAETFPRTADLVNNYCEEVLHTYPERVRFMRLQGGKLGRHTDITDRFAGTADGKLTRLHIPIFTNEHVTVQGWELTGTLTERKWHEGGLFYLDQRKPHEVVNADPNLARVHLVFDVFSNEHVRERLR